MAYYQPDGIKAFALSNGGIEFLVTNRGATHSRVVGPEGCVSLIQASRMLQPPVSRVAVFKWIEKGKLRATMVEGRYLITLTDLRRFAEKYGKGWAPPAAEF